MKSLIQKWRLRKWHRNPTALERFDGLRPATIITGASEGIGLEICRLLTGSRGVLVLIARNQQRLEQAATELSGQRAEIITLPLDITQPNAADVMQETAARHGLYIDELINSAGIGISGDFAELPPENIDRLIDLNITALNRLTRAALPDMLIRGRGGIINFASLGGLTPGPHQAAYYASKAYVISLTRAIANETRGMGLSIVTVAPGPVETKFHAKMDAERAFYRILLPAMSPQAVAKSTLFWYGTGRKVIIPGLTSNLLALALRVLPGALTVPALEFLLNPGDDERDA